MVLFPPSRQSKDSTIVTLALKHARITEMSEQNEGFRFCKKSEPAIVPFFKDIQARMGIELVYHRIDAVSYRTVASIV